MLGLLIVAALGGALACMIRPRRSGAAALSGAVGTVDAASAAGCASRHCERSCVATAAFAFTAGLLESVSFVRISSFVFPLMIAIAAIVGQVVDRCGWTAGAGAYLSQPALCPVPLTVVRRWRRPAGSTGTSLAAVVDQRASVCRRALQHIRRLPRSGRLARPAQCDGDLSRDARSLEEGRPGESASGASTS